MKAFYARIIFLSICIMLAILLIAKLIDSITSGIIFAVSLILFGVASKGFSKK